MENLLLYGYCVDKQCMKSGQEGPVSTENQSIKGKTTEKPKLAAE